jgi:hypothetical protein
VRADRRQHLGVIDERARLVALGDLSSAVSFRVGDRDEARVGQLVQDARVAGAEDAGADDGDA